MSSSNYGNYYQSGKPSSSPVQPRGFVANRDTMSNIGGKVPPMLSMHGSNSLRGGRKTFNAMCLNDNWYEDRLNPDLRNELSLFTAPDVRPMQATFDPWATEYTVAYSKGDWRNVPIKIASSTIFAIDENGTRDWTSSYRHDFRNRQQEAFDIYKRCNQAEQQRAEEAHERLAQAAEARRVQWPLTPDIAARIKAERDEAGDARSNHLRALGGEQRSQQGEENRNSREEREAPQRCYADARAPREAYERRTPRSDCQQPCEQYHRSAPDRQEYAEATNDLNRSMQGLDMNREATRAAAGQRKETVRFADSFRHR